MCKQTAVYQIEMFETTPVVKVEFEPTIRLPQCDECYIELEVVSHVGLTLDRCSFNFTARLFLLIQSIIFKYC